MPSICIISPVNKPFTTARAAQTLHETGDAVFRDGSHGLQSFKSIVGRLTSDALERQDAQWPNIHLTCVGLAKNDPITVIAVRKSLAWDFDGKMCIDAALPHL